jgi:hypothetical protein
MRCAALLVAGLLAVPVSAADLSTLDRSIHKEPAYAGKPRYCLLVFGPDARERVWLVQDGDTLYVDRNGNGDLTEPGEKIAAATDAAPKEDGHAFEAGDVTVGGKVHKGLTVGLTPLKRFADNPALAEIAVIRDAFKADPGAVVARVGVDVASTRFTGAGVGKRIGQSAGFYDLGGVFAFAATPAAVPVVHFDGPLQVSFYGELPQMRVGRSTDLILTVGTPGSGDGTFAMLAYQDTIPAGVQPKASVMWPGGCPKPETVELKQRC